MSKISPFQPDSHLHFSLQDDVTNRWQQRLSSYCLTGRDRKFAPSLKPHWSVSRFRLPRAPQQAPVPNKPWKGKKLKIVAIMSCLCTVCLYGVPWKVLGVLQYSPCFHLGLGKSHDLNISDEKCMQMSVMEIVTNERKGIWYKSSAGPRTCHWFTDWDGTKSGIRGSKRLGFPEEVIGALPGLKLDRVYSWIINLPLSLLI